MYKYPKKHRSASHDELFPVRLPLAPSADVRAVDETFRFVVDVSMFNVILRSFI